MKRAAIECDRGSWLSIARSMTVVSRDADSRFSQKLLSITSNFVHLFDVVAVTTECKVQSHDVTTPLASNPQLHPRNRFFHTHHRHLQQPMIQANTMPGMHRTKLGDVESTTPRNWTGIFRLLLSYSHINFALMIEHELT
jgi:hypothetical protein